LIFVLLGMSAIVELKTFYKHVDGVVPEHSGIGHFNIFKIEDLHLPANRKPNYSRRSFYKVSLITGYNKLHYADKCKEVNGTALIFSNPTIPYFWETVSEKQSGYMCIFTEPFFNRFVHIKDYPVFQFTDSAVINLSKQEAATCKQLFSKMYTELQGDYVYKYDLLRNMLMELIHEAQKINPASATFHEGANAAERLTDMFIELLERQFPIELNYQVMKLNSPAAFAHQLNVHVNHLNKALKTITGRTTTQWVNDRMLQEAKVLLKMTSWTIAEIAHSLGFEESNHFSGFFKSRAKITASDYRQSLID
jgi:AraC family transcriptional activator of pobA